MTTNKKTIETFADAIAWLNTLTTEDLVTQRKQTPSLTRMNALLDGLERPDAKYEHRFIVGGTAGKGSTCANIESGLIAAGKTVCTLMSPHVQVITERIRINGQLISETDFVTALAYVKEVSNKNNIQPSYFEALLAAGIYAGQAAGCEYLVAEVGLGGKWDGTNAIVGSRSAAVTFIGRDHMHILGPKLQNVAQTKAGIYSGDLQFAYTYEKNNFAIMQNESPLPITRLKGVVSNLNKKLAKRMIKDAIGWTGEVPQIKLPARWERVSDRVVLDGAHAKDRFKLIAPKLRKITPSLICGMVQTHDFEPLVSLLPFVKRVYWTKAEKSGKDFYAPEMLQKHFQSLFPDLKQEIMTPDAALEDALKYQEKIVVTGSFYLCGEVRSSFYASKEILKQQTITPEN